MAEPVDLAAVSNAMLELEDQRADPRPEVPVGEVCAKMLGVAHSEEFDAALLREGQRVMALMDGHYRRIGSQVTPVSIACLGIAQGISFAAAVAKVKPDPPS